MPTDTLSHDLAEALREARTHISFTPTPSEQRDRWDRILAKCDAALSAYDRSMQEKGEVMTPPSPESIADYLEKNPPATIHCPNCNTDFTAAPTPPVAKREGELVRKLRAWLADDEATAFEAEPLIEEAVEALSLPTPDAGGVTISLSEARRICDRLEYDASWDKAGTGYYALKAALTKEPKE